MNIRIIAYIIFSLILVKIKSGIADIIDNNYSKSKYNDYYYLNLYKIPLSMMSFKSNGNYVVSNSLQLAFDGDFNTHWESAEFLGDSFLIDIQITFSKTVIIDRILYQAPSNKNWKGIGYPIEFKIYFKLKNSDGTLSDDDSDFLLIDDIISERTGDRVLFIFNEEIMCDQIKLEWADIEETTAHYKRAMASEILLLVPENEIINKLLFDVFQPNDYFKLLINPEYNDLNIIDEIEEKIKEDYFINVEEANELIDRAKQIIRDEIEYEPRREFTTNQTAYLNIINQYGDIEYYSKNTLKMKKGATNRQCTGIFGFSNETITIYVQSNFDDPLPSIRFSQYIGIYNKWLDSSTSLKIGKNILKIKNFDISDIELNIKPGGPIYFENPYTTEEQSQNVKFYIEGGTLFPLFRLNDDENTFKNILHQYLINYNKTSDLYYNIVEFYSDRITITLNASYAYDIYNIKGESPQQNLLIWDKVMKYLYIFDGIQFEENQPYYDKKNEFLNIHVRYSQNYKKGTAAYAWDNHIGIFYQDYFHNSLVSYEEIGRSLVHEIGHMIDVSLREYAEITNVVFEEYAVQTIYKHIYNRQRFQTIYTNIAPDNIDNLLRFCNFPPCKGFFNNAGGYVYPHYIWWDIESFYPGYWGKLDNLYRYNTSLTSGLDKNEAMVFLTNLIL